TVKMAETIKRQIQSGGRITIPKEWREEYGLKQGTKVKMRRVNSKIEIEVPTQLTSLYGLVKTEEPCDTPKRKAREHITKTIKRKLQEDH
ncbi:MAG: AbrB/MazE/SpoVT family DNA-binding domain-containing protein, partial [Thermoproteota archaeon]